MRYSIAAKGDVKGEKSSAKLQINPKLSPNNFPLASFCATKNTIIRQKEGFLVKVKRQRLVIENRLEI